jgi:hypothetical protein
MEEERKSYGNRFILHQRIVSAVERVEFFSDGMPCIVLRGCWFIIIDFNVHATSKDDSKDCFYEEIEDVFDLFPN